jgi:chorismate mutase
LRKRIDRLDLRLLRLLNRRASLAVRVGELKRRRAQGVWDPARERRVLEQIRRANQGPLADRSVREIFSAILRASRHLQHDTTIARSHSRRTVKRPLWVHQGNMAS